MRRSIASSRSPAGAGHRGAWHPPADPCRRRPQAQGRHAGAGHQPTGWWRGRGSMTSPAPRCRPRCCRSRQPARARRREPGSVRGRRQSGGDEQRAAGQREDQVGPCSPAQRPPPVDPRPTMPSRARRLSHRGRVAHRQPAGRRLPATAGAARGGRRFAPAPRRSSLHCGSGRRREPTALDGTAIDDAALSRAVQCVSRMCLPIALTIALILAGGPRRAWCWPLLVKTYRPGARQRCRAACGGLVAGSLPEAPAACCTGPQLVAHGEAACATLLLALGAMTQRCSNAPPWCAPSGSARAPTHWQAALAWSAARLGAADERHRWLLEMARTCGVAVHRWTASPAAAGRRFAAAVRHRGARPPPIPATRCGASPCWPRSRSSRRAPDDIAPAADAPVASLVSRSATRRDWRVTKLHRCRRAGSAKRAACRLHYQQGRAVSCPPARRRLRRTQRSTRRLSQGCSSWCHCWPAWVCPRRSPRAGRSRTAAAPLRLAAAAPGDRRGGSRMAVVRPAAGARRRGGSPGRRLARLLPPRLCAARCASALHTLVCRPAAMRITPPMWICASPSMRSTCASAVPASTRSWLGPGWGGCCAFITGGLSNEPARASAHRQPRCSQPGGPAAARRAGLRAAVHRLQPGAGAEAAWLESSGARPTSVLRVSRRPHTGREAAVQALMSAWLADPPEADHALYALAAREALSLPETLATALACAAELVRWRPVR